MSNLDASMLYAETADPLRVTEPVLPVVPPETVPPIAPEEGAGPATFDQTTTPGKEGATAKASGGRAINLNTAAKGKRQCRPGCDNTDRPLSLLPAGLPEGRRFAREDRNIWGSALYQ